MANFTEWFAFASQREGYYANVSGDKGGETYRGVSRKNHPAWLGWQIVDAEKRKNGGSLPRNYRINNATLDKQVAALAKAEYWDFFQADKIRSQEVAEALVDFGWLSGRATAAQTVQRLLNLNPDGRIGAATLAAINRTSADRLFDRIQQARLDRFDAIIKSNPDQLKFLNGWRDRVLALESPKARLGWKIAIYGLGITALSLTGVYAKQKLFKRS